MNQPIKIVMKKHPLAILAAAFAVAVLSATAGMGAPGTPAGESGWPAASTIVSGAASPRVAYGIRRDRGDLLLVIEADALADAVAGGAGDVTVRAGLAAKRDLLLDSRDATATVRDGARTGFRFRVPAAALGGQTPPASVRMAFVIEWAGGAGQPPRQRESFLHTLPRAPHAGLSGDSAQWQPLDLDEAERTARDRDNKIVLDFQQPLDGKATVVIEDAGGRRIRNLVSGAALGKGAHRLEWDGLDERGNPVPPGDYRWRAISHPGLTPVFQFSFADGPGSTHGTLHAAATNGRLVFLGTPVSEGGYHVVALDKDGTFVRGFNAHHGVGLSRIALAADSRHIYAAYDGLSWGVRVDRFKPDWKAVMRINLVRFDIEAGKVADYARPAPMPLLVEYEIGPGAAGAREETTGSGGTLGQPLGGSGARKDDTALAGLVLFRGKLYLAEKHNGRLLEIAPETGAITREFPLPDPVALAVRGGDAELLAVVGKNRLVRISPDTGETTPLAVLPGSPAGIATDAAGRIYVSDAATHVVHVLNPQGAPAAVIGKPGGAKPGAYDPLRLQNPAGLIVHDDLVWVTEPDRWQPKRYAAYRIDNGRMAMEFFGPTNYGAQGAGFDDTDHTRWFGQGTLFKLDFDKHSVKPLAITGGQEGRRHTYWRQDGRVFIITSGKATWIQELRGGTALRPLACISSAHQFAYAHGWRPPQAFIDAFRRDYPAVKLDIDKHGGLKGGQPAHGYGMLWVDRNDDGEMQAGEIEFSTAAENFAGAGWSHDFHDLTLRVPATVRGRNVLVTLKPQGWWPGGVPKYPPLNDAVRAAIPIDLPGSPQVSSATDRFDNIILNSTPDMRAFAPDGRLLWTYPNKWTDVHGSHDAPLPSPGEMQGALFFSGVAPLDDNADVVLLNGNHGRAFVLTTDGLYLDEMFPDVRLMTNPQASGVGILGGECFGGTFGRSQKDGNYYFQGGGISYRIYRIDGLRGTTRSRGTLTVGPGQAAAAERALLRKKTEATLPRSGTVAWRDKPPVVDGRADDWPGAPAARWDRGGRFAITARLAYDATSLYLHYTVRDESPWVNNGTDWQALFKTGDGIDLQLGADPAANPARPGPVPGDFRLFIAPMGRENVAVLYKHRVPGAPESAGVTFQSPWRGERVDVVRRLDKARIAVIRSAGEYSVEAAIPLADLGLADTLRHDAALRGDIGIIYGDAAGTANIFRNYWSNQATGLINDVPGEIMLTPSAWGALHFAAPAAPAGTANPTRTTNPAKTATP
jgi:hypothetical protein